MTLVKHYNVTMDEDHNQFKITCQCCTGFVTCSVMSRELIYITFVHSVISNLGIYHEELVTEKLCFQCPVRTKIQRMYHNVLTEVNGNNKYLMCPNLQYNNFEVLHSAIELDKADLVRV